MSLAYWRNTGWMWSCRREARQFRRDTRGVAQAQRETLRRILAANAGTEFGRRHGFREPLYTMKRGSAEEFQRRVPLANYETFRGDVARIAAGEENVLTAERVEMLEPTSGSSNCGEKLIPCTAALRGEFQRAVAVWVDDLLRGRPAARHGRAYWSISPAFGARRKSGGGIPIGFDDDAAYLSGWERWMVKRLLVSPPGIARVRAMEDFRYVTLLHLLAADDLALISVWSPTFLTSLLAPVEESVDRICDDLQRGTVSAPVGGDPALEGMRLRGKHRAGELRGIFRANASLGEKLRQVWPRLDVISCWADGTAANFVEGVRRLFPEVMIQPKGLLATEGCVSVPLLGRDGAALAIRSHFFEFVAVGNSPEDGEVFLAHELKNGWRYQVVLTTGGGLYRYQLHDVVEVVGYENECPLLRFAGRADRVCDLAGEKLCERHVQSALERVWRETGSTPAFCLVAPRGGERRGYRVFAHVGKRVADGSLLCSLARRIEDGFCENPYYRHAVAMGQLEPLDVRLLDGSADESWNVYERVCVGRGQKMGDIKPKVLDEWPGWSAEFDGLSQTGGSMDNLNDARQVVSQAARGL